MNTKWIFLVFVVFVLSFQMTGFSGPEEWALNVEIQPEYPTIYDPIDIISSGISGSGGVTIEDTFLQIIGTDLNYDLFITVGPLTVITPWSYTENIGILPAGTYDLAVTAYYDYDGFTASEEFITSFDVVIPEPASIMLLGLGGIFSRRKR